MPILFVDVKLKDGSFDRISVHRGDDIGHLSLTFARKHNLDEAAKSKLELLLRRKVADTGHFSRSHAPSKTKFTTHTHAIRSLRPRCIAHFIQP